MEILHQKADWPEQADLPVAIQIESPGENKIFLDETRQQDLRVAPAALESPPSRGLKLNDRTDAAWPSLVFWVARPSAPAKADLPDVPAGRDLRATGASPPASELQDRGEPPSSIPRQKCFRTRDCPISAGWWTRSEAGETQDRDRESGRAARSDGAPREDTDKAAHPPVRAARPEHRGTAKDSPESHAASTSKSKACGFSTLWCNSRLNALRLHGRW